MTTKTLVGFLHLSGMILQNVYGLITSTTNITKTTDPIYFLQFLLTTLSWVACKDECLVSYWIKKQQNPEYILGQSPHDNSDMSCFFNNPLHYIYFQHINNVLRIVSLFIVNYRGMFIPNGLFVPMLLLYAFYVNDVFCEWNYRKRILIKW